MRSTSCAPANDDQKVGIEIVRRALQSPVRQIAENAGFDGAVVAGKMLDQKDTNFGFDAQKGDYVDMVKAGIIDPVKVVRTALQDAASVAGLLVTTEAMVAEKPEKKAPADAAGRRHGRRHGLLSPAVFRDYGRAGERSPAFSFGIASTRSSRCEASLAHEVPRFARDDSMDVR